MIQAIKRALRRWAFYRENYGIIEWLNELDVSDWSIIEQMRCLSEHDLDDIYILLGKFRSTENDDQQQQRRSVVMQALFRISDEYGMKVLTSTRYNDLMKKESELKKIKKQLKNEQKNEN